MKLDIPLIVEIVNFFLALVAIVMSVVAIKFAVEQNRDAKKTLNLTTEALRKLDATAATLSETATQLPTRYIGKFPGNIKEIVGLMSKAQREIAILTDFAGYGSYSSPELFWEYQQALIVSLKTNPNLCVKLFAYNSKLREDVIRAQFEGFDLFKGALPDDAKEKLERFVKKMDKVDVKVIDQESLIRGLLDDELNYLRNFDSLDRFECYEVHSALPIFLWMIDGQECIFSFENEQNYFSFRTRDGRLIDYFQHYMKTPTSKATPLRRTASGVTPGPSVI